MNRFLEHMDEAFEAAMADMRCDRL
ncbi:MAG: hypothetical protein AB1547_08530 [Thermodesulfobacteriota bacterium]